MGRGYSVICTECPSKTELFIGVGMMGQNVGYYCPECGEIEHVHFPRTADSAFIDATTLDTPPPFCSTHTATPMVMIEEPESFMGGDQPCPLCGGRAYVQADLRDWD